MLSTFPRLRFVVLSLALGTAPTAPAQQTSLKVEDVLAHVRENLASFRATIPNVSADEALASKRIESGKIKKQTTVQSSFRLVHDPQKKEFHEGRTFHAVNDKPYDGKAVSLPWVLQGGFTAALSALNSPCIEFQLAPDGGTANGSIVLTGTQRPASKEPPVCPNFKRELRVLVDAHTFQIERLESIGHDLHFRGGIGVRMFGNLPSDHNSMTTVVSYSPVALGAATFYLPTKVEDVLTDSSKPLVLSWEAAYSNYHLYTATSTILSDSFTQDSQ